MFYMTDHGSPISIIRKSFLTGETWNASIMSDAQVYNTWKKLNTDPNLKPKQLDAELKKTEHLYHRKSAGHIIVRFI
jgi:hypothetical protein